MTKDLDVVAIGIRDGRVVLTLVDDVYLMTPKAARVYGLLMAHVADWIDPVVAEHLEEPD